MPSPSEPFFANKLAKDFSKNFKVLQLSIHYGVNNLFKCDHDHYWNLPSAVFFVFISFKQPAMRDLTKRNIYYYSQFIRRLYR